MIFPRETALAEVAWLPEPARNFDDFSRRLQVEFQRFNELGINYRRNITNLPATSTAK
jgi:hexosaminidase